MKAHELCCYTVQITVNKNVFTEEYRSAITDRIVDAAISIHTMAWNANNILVQSAEDYRERRRLQDEAARQCNTLLSLMQIAWKIFHLSAKRVEYWGAKTVETRNLIRAWRDADAARYKRWDVG